MTDGNAPVLRIENLSVDFSTRGTLVHAVRGVSLEIGRGETLGLLGESGSGKSVTAAAVMGLIDCPPGFIRSGRIVYNDADLLKVSPAVRRQISGAKISMIFQDPLAALNPVYSVGWQVAEALRVHGGGRADASTEALRLLERVGIPDAARRRHDYPHQFSGGQRQRIMIATAIAMQPDLLIADEPTTALDVTVQAQILRLLKELQADTAMSILMITHDLGVVAEVADRVAVMQGGRVVETGRVEEVFSRPKHAYTAQLLRSVPGRGKLAKPGPMQAHHLVEVRALTKCFGSFRAVDSVSFEIRRGESLGVVGESGSGKTTLARLLLALDRPTAGTILHDGKDLQELSRAEMFRYRRRVQVVFQDPTASLNPLMTAEQIITEPWAVHKGVVPKAQWGERVRELLGQVGLEPDHARRYPGEFSGGQRQRIAIARALALSPELIICDEAVSSLDVSVQAQVIELLKRLRHQFGLSYLFIAHDLGVVRDFCERVLVMHEGRIVEAGWTADVFDDPQHPYTRELLAANPVLERRPDGTRKDGFATASGAGGPRSRRLGGPSRANMS